MICHATKFSSAITAKVGVFTGSKQEKVVYRDGQIELTEYKISVVGITEAVAIRRESHNVCCRLFEL